MRIGKFSTIGESTHLAVIQNAVDHFNKLSLEKKLQIVTVGLSQVEIPSGATNHTAMKLALEWYLTLKFAEYCFDNKVILDKGLAILEIELEIN